MIRYAGFALFTLTLIAAPTVCADIPVEPRRPRPAPAPAGELVPLTIRRDASVNKRHPSVEAKIVIPKKFLAELARGESFGLGESDDAPGRGFPWTTVIAGIALSLAAVSAIRLIRRRDARWAAAGALVLIVTCGAWNLAQADLGVPSGKPRRPPVPRDPDAPAKPRATIQIETPDEGDEVILILKP